MKLISRETLGRLRRGAELLHGKYRHNLPDAKVVLRADIAEDLGLEFEAPASVQEQIEKSKIGLFDDEPEPEVAKATPMAKVALTDYIEALQGYQPDGSSQVEKPAEPKPTSSANAETR